MSKAQLLERITIEPGIRGQRRGLDLLSAGPSYAGMLACLEFAARQADPVELAAA